MKTIGELFMATNITNIDRGSGVIMGVKATVGVDFHRATGDNQAYFIRWTVNNQNATVIHSESEITSDNRSYTTIANITGDFTLTVTLLGPDHRPVTPDQSTTQRYVAYPSEALTITPTKVSAIANPKTTATSQCTTNELVQLDAKVSLTTNFPHPAPLLKGIGIELYFSPTVIDGLFVFSNAQVPTKTLQVNKSFIATTDNAGVASFFIASTDARYLKATCGNLDEAHLTVKFFSITSGYDYDPPVIMALDNDTLALVYGQDNFDVWEHIDAPGPSGSIYWTQLSTPHDPNDLTSENDFYITTPTNVPGGNVVVPYSWLQKSALPINKLQFFSQDPNIGSVFVSDITPFAVTADFNMPDPGIIPRNLSAPNLSPGLPTGSNTIDVVYIQKNKGIHVEFPPPPLGATATVTFYLNGYNSQGEAITNTIVKDNVRTGTASITYAEAIGYGIDPVTALMRGFYCEYYIITDGSNDKKYSSYNPNWLLNTLLP